ncbi:GldL-related protein [Zobellia amurskyensis]|uniref:GldL-related protein n=1 Tax=Zobellia amurskyensis TaxID=248905 RepID=UPI00191FDE0E
MITKQKTNLFLRLSIALAIIAVLFKLMHWQYSEVLLVIAVGGIALFYSIWFSKKSSKEWLDYAKLFLLISFLLHYLFKVLHLNYGFVFSFIFKLALVAFIIIYLKNQFFTQKDSHLESKKPASQKKLYTIWLNTMAAVCIIMGAQFKILHWEFGLINGHLLLTVGLIAAALSILTGFKKF